MACVGSEQAGRPTSHWTSREIADELIIRGIVGYMSRRRSLGVERKFLGNTRSLRTAQHILAEGVVSNPVDADGASTVRKVFA